MCLICPKCKAIAEYNAYYGRITCTRCSWESEKTKLDKRVRVSRVTPTRKSKALAKV